MVSKCLVLSVMALVILVIPGLAQQTQQTPEIPWECRLRVPSLSESACAERLRPGAPRLPECAQATGNDGYRMCAVRQPSDEILAEQRREMEQEPALAEAARKRLADKEDARRKKLAADAEDVHKRLSEKLKAAGIVLPAGMSRLPTPTEVQRDCVLDPKTSEQDFNWDRCKKASREADETERRAINAGLGEIVFPDEVRRIQSIQDLAERAESYTKQHPTLTLAECRIHLRLGMSADQVFDNCGKPLQHFQRQQGGDILVYSGGAILIVPPIGLSEVIEDNSWHQVN